jgi:hypothetical protein
MAKELADQKTDERKAADLSQVEHSVLFLDWPQPETSWLSSKVEEQMWLCLTDALGIEFLADFTSPTTEEAVQRRIAANEQVIRPRARGTLLTAQAELFRQAQEIRSFMDENEDVPVFVDIVGFGRGNVLASEFCRQLRVLREAGYPLKFSVTFLNIIDTGRLEGPGSGFARWLDDPIVTDHGANRSRHFYSEQAFLRNNVLSSLGPLDALDLLLGGLAGILGQLAEYYLQAIGAVEQFSVGQLDEWAAEHCYPAGNLRHGLINYRVPSTGIANVSYAQLADMFVDSSNPSGPWAVPAIARFCNLAPGTLFGQNFCHWSESYLGEFVVDPLQDLSQKSSSDAHAKSLAPVEFTPRVISGEGFRDLQFDESWDLLQSAIELLNSEDAAKIFPPSMTSIQSRLEEDVARGFPQGGAWSTADAVGIEELPTLGRAAGETYCDFEGEQGIQQTVSTASMRGLDVTIEVDLEPLPGSALGTLFVLYSGYQAGRVVPVVSFGREIRVITVPRIDSLGNSGPEQLVLYSAGGIRLHSVEVSTELPCPGDVDLDGDTDLEDFHIFANNFGGLVPPGSGGDLDGDGALGLGDFRILANNFGCGTF